MPAPTLVPETSAALQDAIKRGDDLFIVAVSGTPQIVAHVSLACPDSNPTACDKWTREHLVALPSIIRRYPAKQTQADLLAAIDLAQQNISSASGPKQIITIDSGIDTTGALDMTDLSAVLPADHGEIATRLRERGFTADLTGTSIIMSGLGQTAEPQRRLSPPDESALVDTWTKVLKAAGAAPVEVAAETLTGQQSDVSLPRVSPAVYPPPPNPVNLCKEFRFNEADMGFVSDKATFRNRNRAIRALSGIAMALKKTGLNVILTGTTAYRELRSSDPLSNARAQAAKRVLISLGVPAFRILTQGVGVNFKGYHDPHHNPIKEIRMRLVLVDPTCPGNHVVNK